MRFISADGSRYGLGAVFQSVFAYKHRKYNKASHTYRIYDVLCELWHTVRILHAFASDIDIKKTTTEPHHI